MRYALLFFIFYFTFIQCLIGIDRNQPSCGWCTRNGQLCEYKERKKPGLRAGYGKELEQRLGRFTLLYQIDHG